MNCTALDEPVVVAHPPSSQAVLVRVVGHRLGEDPLLPSEVRGHRLQPNVRDSPDSPSWDFGRIGAFPPIQSYTGSVFSPYFGTALAPVLGAPVWCPCCGTWRLAVLGRSQPLNGVRRVWERVGSRASAGTPDALGGELRRVCVLVSRSPASGRPLSDGRFPSTRKALRLEGFPYGPCWARTSDLGIKSLAEQTAARLRRRNLPANQGFQRCSETAGKCSLGRQAGTLTVRASSPLGAEVPVGDLTSDVCVRRWPPIQPSSSMSSAGSRPGHGSYSVLRRRSYAESRAVLPQQACSSSLWSQNVGSASAAVITSTSRRDASSPPPSSLMTSRVGIHHLAHGEPPRTTSVEASLRMSSSPQRSNRAGSFWPNALS